MGTYVSYFLDFHATLANEGTTLRGWHDEAQCDQLLRVGSTRIGIL